MVCLYLGIPEKLIPGVPTYRTSKSTVAHKLEPMCFAEEGACVVHSSGPDLGPFTKTVGGINSVCFPNPETGQNDHTVSDVDPEKGLTKKGATNLNTNFPLGLALKRSNETSHTGLPRSFPTSPQEAHFCSLQPKGEFKPPLDLKGLCRFVNK